MKYTRNVPTTKNGKELPQGTIANNRKKLSDRINEELVCPMNWLQEWLDKIQNLVSKGTIPTKDFFIKMKGTANNRQMSKIRGIVEEYDRMIKSYYAKYGGTEEYIEKLIEESDFVVEQLRKVKIGNAVTINRLIEVALGLNAPAKNKKLDYKQGTKYTRKMLNLLYKMDREKFLANFVRKTT
jgi:ribosome-binding protein aMBF1 (putative translation factor)